MKQCSLPGYSRIRWSLFVIFTTTFSLYLLQYKVGISFLSYPSKAYVEAESTTLSLMEGNSDMCEMARKGTLRVPGTTNASVPSGQGKVQSNSNRLPNEVQNVVFVKVHKAASTTMMNIILRFAVSRKLNVMIPKHENLINEGHYKINQDDILPVPPGEKYNVLGNHLIFNENEIRRYFPESTKFIGIVREPFSQFSSAFYFYALVYHDPRYVKAIQDNPVAAIHHFLSKPLEYDNVPANTSFTNNRMSIDFGFPVANLEKNKYDAQKVRDFVSHIDKTFQFIVVVEMFDESLILLRRMLHWTIKDILYIKSNRRHSEQEWTSKFFTSRYSQEADRVLHQEWAPIDYALYKHFSNKVKEIIQNQPLDFREELVSFQDLRGRITEFCQKVKKANSKKRSLGINSTRWNPGFCVRFEDCRQLLMNEMDITHTARLWQMKKLADKHPRRNV